LGNRGRNGSYGNEIEKELLDWVLSLRQKGACIRTVTVIEKATCGQEWARWWLAKNGFRSRLGATAKTPQVEDNQVRENFLNQISLLIVKFSVPKAF